jgi:hypothetical protein
MNLFFCLSMEVSIRKKMTGNCIIAHDAKFLSFFFADGYFIHKKKKPNKFISYHLIISKHRCNNYGIKLCIFPNLFMHYIFCDVWVGILWRLNIASQIDGYKIHPLFQPIEKHVTCKIKWFNCQAMLMLVRNSIRKPILSEAYRVWHL